MKNMTSLMKMEIILMKRQAVYYLLSIGLPSVFYLIFSGMMSGSDIPEIALQAYLFAMTVFSIMSSAFFSIPSTLESDKTNFLVLNDSTLRLVNSDFEEPAVNTKDMNYDLKLK